MKLTPMPQMSNLLENFKQESANLQELFQKELSSIRSNRPSPAMIENLKVFYFEGTQPLSVNQMGSIKVIPPREIDITVWDPNSIQAVAKAVEDAGLGLSVRVDGNTIRADLPALTAERRKEIVKQAGKISEGFKIRLRQARDDANKKIVESEKAGEIGEDEKFKLKDGVQKITEETNQKIEEALSKKMEEINFS